MGSAPSQQVEKPNVSDFGYLAGVISQVGRLSPINGFEATHVYQLRKNINLVQTLSVAPRLYPLELAPKVNEPKQPGSYSAVIIGDIIDMSYRLSYQRNGRPAAEITVPLNKQISLTLGSDIHYNPEITGVMKFASPFISTDFSFTFSDYLKKGNIVGSVAFMVKKLSFGALISQSLGLDSSMIRFALSHPLKNGTFGVLINRTDHWSFTLSTKHDFQNTSTGFRFEFAPVSLQTLLSFGFERDFIMSKIQVAAGTDGALVSVYRRKIGAEKQITFSSATNLINREYSFGLGLLLN